MCLWEKIKKEPSNFLNFFLLVFRIGAQNPLSSVLVVTLYTTSIFSLLNARFGNSFIFGSLASLISIHMVIYEYNQLYIRALDLALDRLESIKHVNETTKDTYNRTVKEVTVILEGKDA